MKLTGSKYQCSDCLRHFAGATSFAQHRTGEYAPGQRTCLTAGDMMAIGMRQSRTGFWLAQPQETVS